MRLELLEPGKGLRATSAGVRLRSGVNTNMPVQFAELLGAKSTVRTLVRPAAAVDIKTVTPQGAVGSEASVTQKTTVQSRSGVDRAVTVQAHRLAERLPAYMTFVRFLSAVNSTMAHEAARRCEPSAACAARERPDSRVTPAVYRQLSVSAEAQSALRTPELAAVRVHVLPQVTVRRKTLVTLIARVQVNVSGLRFSTIIPITIPC